MCGEDDGGVEVVVGVRAEVERDFGVGDGAGDKRGGEDRGEWVEVGIQMGGEESGALEDVLREGLLADGRLVRRLRVGKGWHWRVFVDVGYFFFFLSLFLYVLVLGERGAIPELTSSSLPKQILLLSPPHTYPLPLLSLTTHLALLTTRLPAPISGLDDDPLFNDDYAAATPLYAAPARPPVTVLVIAVGENVFFDPSREELAVADAVVAVSFCARVLDNKDAIEGAAGVHLLAVRTVEPPGRQAVGMGEAEDGMWKRRRGGVSRGVLVRMVQMVVQRGGIGEEVLSGLKEWV